jgi:hypothetical protein
VSAVAGGRISGPITQEIGYTSFFLLTFFLAVPAWFLLPAIRRTLPPASRAGA